MAYIDTEGVEQPALLVYPYIILLQEHSVLTVYDRLLIDSESMETWHWKTYYMVSFLVWLGNACESFLTDSQARAFNSEHQVHFPFLPHHTQPLR